MPALHNCGPLSVHSVLLISGQRFNCASAACRLWRVKEPPQCVICVFVCFVLSAVLIITTTTIIIIIISIITAHMAHYEPPLFGASRLSGPEGIMTLNYDYFRLRPFCIFSAMCWRWSGSGGVEGCWWWL